jgi:RHS repeat-associated protein
MKRLATRFKIEREFRAVIWVIIACFFSVLLPLTTRSQLLPSSPNLIPGQTATKLADGKLLLLGGESGGRGTSTASIWDPTTNVTTRLSNSLNQGRAWHTATVLPDGLVLILGGVSNGNQIVATAELFDPATQTFTNLPASGVTPRARHTATLLSDGHVLIAGGVALNGQPIQTAELWDAVDPSAVTLSSSLADRRDHSATLLADGRVLIWGGADGAGNALNNGELFDPSTQGFTSLTTFPSALLPLSTDGPALVASIPLDRSVDIDIESLVSLRFSKPLRPETVNANTVSLTGPKGLEKILVAPAENGSLAFLTPDEHLLPGSTYTVTVNGAVDRDGLLLPISGITFSTKPAPGAGQPSSTSSGSSSTSTSQQRPQTETESSDDEFVWRGKLKDGKPHSDWQDLPPLQAAPGETALSGQVLDLRGLPLAKVKLELESHYGARAAPVETDETGRFLLTGISPGWGELIIDGHKARRRLNEHSAAHGSEEDHGLFEYGLKIKKGETLVLPFTIWLPKIDTQHAVPIPQKPSTEFIVTTPKIKGLELRLPANGALLGRDYQPVKEVSLTPIPVDRPPFPLPQQVDVPVYFTAQPGGAYVHNPGGIGARIYYPNRYDELPGTRFDFWHYDPGYDGWYKYGRGTVLEDGKQVTPDPGISIYEFTGGMYQGGGGAGGGPGPCPSDQKCDDGDPVNLGTGLFVLKKTDLYVADGVMPIALTRTYRPNDTVSRAFGLGASHPFELFIKGIKYTTLDLVLADGGEIHFVRISPGTGFADAVFEHTSTQSVWYKSTIRWVGGWELKRQDGMRYYFPDSELAGRYTGAGVLSITDRNGNVTTIQRDGGGNPIRITSPSSRWIELTYDGANRVTQAKDNAGRTVVYEYDTNGRLFRVTDPNGGTNEYTYNTLNRMTTIKDARGIVFITNEYDTTGKVIQQTMVDGGIYQFNYTLNGSTITQTDVTDPRGKIRRVTFNAAGHITSDTLALGLPEEQVTTYNLQTGTNFRQSKVDALGRTTSYTYDSAGNLASITRLAGTGDAVTTTYTYEPQFNQIATITDPLNHTTTYNYDLEGNLVSITNALGETTTFVNNPTGQLASVTNPAGQTTQITYDLGDSVSIADPLGNVTNRLFDSAGRIVNQTDPRGTATIYEYDGENRLTKTIDPLSGSTNFNYDPNGNLLNVTDARSNETTYTYENMDRLATRRDPLLRTESYQYDLAGNMTQLTDRKNQITNYTYDGINRRTGVTYADTSTTAYTYDKGNRLTQVVDSIAGTITRTYDGLNRLTSETTPQGSVSYTYDAAGRRATMTVTGQPSVVYSYDNANRLTQITQGSSTVTYTYDAAGRRTSLTLPNGVLVEYGYDGASRLTSITYKQNGTTVLGNLTYEYDKNGNRMRTGGSFARTGGPQTITSTNYNAANHQTTFGDKTLTYDNNGNLQSITDSSGTTTYTWNARNQLVGISGPTVNASFVYDGLGRREKKTINGNLTEFLYDGLNPVQETAGATILANILPGLSIDEFLTRTDVVAGTTSNFLTDALGSPVAVTDNAGFVQTEYTYEPFGKTTFTGASSSNSYQYTGRENDGTALYYYRARYYHAELQRFMSEDPIRLKAGDTNFYAYVVNNPINASDPHGLWGPPSGWSRLQWWLAKVIGGAATGIPLTLGGATDWFNPNELHAPTHENDMPPNPNKKCDNSPGPDDQCSAGFCWPTL